MKMNELGRSGISVSRICLGTMTFGQQNTEADGHAQMEPAVDHDAPPAGSRRALFPEFARNFKPRGIEATGRYVALAYVNSRQFLSATIIGATNLDQFAANLGSEDLVLSEQVLGGIDAIHSDLPNPAL